jgi:hypothetical protein
MPRVNSGQRFPYHPKNDNCTSWPRAHCSHVTLQRPQAWLMQYRKLCREVGGKNVAFICPHAHSVPWSWGNIVEAPLAIAKSWTSLRSVEVAINLCAFPQQSAKGSLEVMLQRPRGGAADSWWVVDARRGPATPFPGKTVSVTPPGFKLTLIAGQTCWPWSNQGQPRSSPRKPSQHSSMSTLSESTLSTLVKNLVKVV